MNPKKVKLTPTQVGEAAMKVGMSSLGILNAGGTGTTSLIDHWGFPTRVAVNEVGESIEMIYKQTSNLSYTSYPPPPPQERVFKIVYSCKDGKWHKSERIFGKIIAPKEEAFDFGE